MRVLILCTGNSCRSQMAEGFLKSFNSSWEVYSAGTKPASKVHPKAVLAMKEAGVDLEDALPKHVEQFLDRSFDYVVTVCDHAKETCPVFMGEVAKQLHLGFDDPAEASGTEEEVLGEFRRIRDEIRSVFRDFYHDSLDREKERTS